MNEWKEKKLKAITEIRVSNVDKKLYPNKTFVRLCNYMDAYSNDHITSKITFSNGSADANQLQRFALKKDDVIITKDSETPDDIAVSSVVTEEFDNLVCGYHLAILRPNKNELDGTFLMLKFKLPEVKNYFSNVANGSTRYGLTISNIENAKISYPSVAEQKRISLIVSTLDSVIEKTQAAIEKYKAIKQGLLHDLFTRGIDVATGKLRPKQQNAPELYKETKLGWVPKEWEVNVFGDKIDLIHGHQFRDFDFVEFGLPVVKIGQVKPDNVDLSGCSFVGANRIEEFKNETIRNGDVLMALTGATLGKACLVSGLNGAVFQNYRVGRFEPYNSEEINKAFIYYKLIAGEVLNQIFNKVNSGAQGNIGKADFEKTLFTQPDFKEQVLIAEKLSSIDAKLTVEQSYLMKVRMLKQGLMNDLLTGKKTVSVAEEELTQNQN